MLALMGNAARSHTILLSNAFCDLVSIVNTGLLPTFFPGSTPDFNATRNVLVDDRKEQV